MKSTFFEFFKPEEPELKKAWDSGIFTFDANVLLNLYRYSNKTTHELFGILKQLKSKLWLSHQAGFEYFNNRLSVIHKQKAAYDDIIQLLDKSFEETSNQLNTYKKHSTIEIDSIRKGIKKAITNIRSEIQKLKVSHPTYEPDDKIRTELLRLFDKRTGEPYSTDKLAEIYKEGQRRYEDKVPPGYMDKNNKKDSSKQSLYGDLILWKQIIDKAKSENKPIILVTDDWKDDWWDKHKGETQGPRKELLREFFNVTGQKVYIYQADKFLEYANKLNVGRQIKAETIKEVREVRRKDEQHINQINQENKLINDYFAKAYTDIFKERALNINPNKELIENIYKSMGVYGNLKIYDIYKEMLKSNENIINPSAHYKEQIKSIGDILNKQNSDKEEETDDGEAKSGEKNENMSEDKNKETE